jgi:hypothetical protein
MVSIFQVFHPKFYMHFSYLLRIWSSGELFCEDPNEALLNEVSLLCKGKEIPLQALTDPEGSRRLRLPDFKTIGT